MKFLHRLRTIKNRLDPYQPIITILISRAAILHNLAAYQAAYPRIACAPVLKSNAYGHDMLAVAKILDGQNIPFIVVDSFFEARTLHGAGIHSHILVMGYTPVHNIIAHHLKRVSFSITSLDQLYELDAATRGTTRAINVHIKIDTGMHRQGILPHEIPSALQILTTNAVLHTEGVCTHLANAHTTNEVSIHAQLAAWEDAVKLFKIALPKIKFFHFANSAGAYFSTHYTCNVVRLGIGMYGFNASPFMQMDVRPALRMETVVSGIKMLAAGESVGYNSSFTATMPTRIATIPIGYYEGIDRRLSNKGVVLIRNTECRIVGDVSMNITCVDVSHLQDLALGENVVVVSDVPSDKNSEQSMSRLINEIPYVLLSRIPFQLRRKVI